MHKIEIEDIHLKSVERHQDESMSWHGLEEVRENLGVNNCGLRDIDVQVADVKLTLNGKEHPSQLKVPCVANPVPGQEGKLLMLSKPYDETYRLFSPRDFVDFAGQCFKQAGLDEEIAFTTTLFSGRRMTISKRIKSADFKDARGNEFYSYINLLNSLDGSWPVFCNVSETRCVCQNTATANLNVGGASVRHTPDALTKFIQRFPETFAEAIKTHESSANDYLLMSDIPFSTSQAAYFYAYLLTDGKGTLSTTSFNIIENSLLRLFKQGAGNLGDNGADIYCAVTEYYTHKGTLESNNAGGSSDTKKRKCKSLLLSDNIQEIIEKGKKIYLDYQG